MDAREILDPVMLAAGFDAWGVAPVEGLLELENLPEWLARGYAGEMRYLTDPRRNDPRQVMPSARSIIVCALNYNTDRPYSTEVPLDPERGWISRYAWGEDYHGILMEKLEAVMAALRASLAEPFEARAYVDTGPVVERVAAKYAGIGWLAKNTCLINEKLGSWLFLGVILTSLELSPTASPAPSGADAAGASPPPDLCGNCRLCIDACPTGAIVEPYVLDARRCISYLTIELRGSIPEEFRAPMGRQVFGCDICQDVCPWNRKSPVSSAPEFLPRTPVAESETRNSIPKRRDENRRVAHPCELVPSGAEGARVGMEKQAVNSSSSADSASLFSPSLKWLASLSEEEFRQIFRASALKRARKQGVLRNILVAMGNSGNARFVPILRKFAEHEDVVLSEAARWALKRFVGA